MEKILQGIPGVVVYIDDILVSGKNEEEHLDSLEEVLGRLEEYGLRLKRGKCLLMQDSVEYLGYRVDKRGLHAMPSKVAAVLEAPEPKSVPELRAFLGLVNYYGKFIRQLATLAQPLNRLLGKDVPCMGGQMSQKAKPDKLTFYTTNSACEQLTPFVPTTHANTYVQTVHGTYVY